MNISQESPKAIRLEPIERADADRFVRAYHYSGRVVRNSQVHIGVFLHGRLGGAMQFGPSLDKRKVIGLVRNTRWHEFIELNRMAFADWLPRNSESRALSVAMRMLRAAYPWMKWVITFADGTQCGDGTIYRAAGFTLTGITRNTTIWKMPDGRMLTNVGLTSARPEAQRRMLGGAVNMAFDGRSSMKQARALGARPLPGYQLRYIYFLDPTKVGDLAVPAIPYGRISEIGAGMYRGRVRGVDSSTAALPGGRRRGGTDPDANLISDYSPQKVSRKNRPRHPRGRRQEPAGAKHDYCGEFLENPERVGHAAPGEPSAGS